MRAFAFSVLIALVGFAAGCGKKSGDSGGSAEDKTAVQGEWAVLKLDMGDKDGAFIEEMMKEAKITVKDNLIIANAPKGKGPGGKDEEPGYAIFTLDGSKSPKEIDFTQADAKGTPKGSKRYDFATKTSKDGPPETLKGIYKLEGDTITVALGMGDKSARPTEFKSVTPKGKGDDIDGVIILQLKKK